MTLKCDHKDSGFSLLELTIVFILTGMMMVFGTQFLNVYMHQARFDLTKKNMQTTEEALTQYYALNGRYPCPADPTLTSSDANYGRGQCRDYVKITTDCNSGIPANIICTTTGSRDADGDGLNDVVLIGAFPFREVSENISGTSFVENTAQDAMHAQFTYAVSEKLANPANTMANPANFSLGAIKVIDENQLDVLDPPSSGHFVLVAHGDNQVGAFAKSGKRISKCLIGLEEDADGDGAPDPAGLNAAGIAPEKENCDNNDAIFTAGLRTLQDGSDYYDDFIKYESTGLRTHWNHALSNADDSIYNTNLGNVGVGVESPEQKLHVAKDISAEGAVAAVTYCKDGADPDCLDPNTIAGEGIKCPAGQVAYGIEENKILCRDLFVSAPVVNCPAGEYLVGISNIGNVVCKPIETSMIVDDPIILTTDDESSK